MIKWKKLLFAEWYILVLSRLVDDRIKIPVLGGHVVTPKLKNIWLTMHDEFTCITQHMYVVPFTLWVAVVHELHCITYVQDGDKYFVSVLDPQVTGSSQQRIKCLVGYDSRLHLSHSKRQSLCKIDNSFEYNIYAFETILFIVIIKCCVW